MKLARNFKKDLEIFKKKRARYSISNIKLPEMKAKDDKFQAYPSMEPVANSPSLKFNMSRAEAENQFTIG